MNDKKYRGLNVRVADEFDREMTLAAASYGMSQSAVIRCICEFFLRSRKKYGRQVDWPPVFMLKNGKPGFLDDEPDP